MRLISSCHTIDHLTSCELRTANGSWGDSGLPGQPLKRKLIAELERRTREAFEDEPEATHMDFVEDWQARGFTLNKLGQECGLGENMGEFISRYLSRTFGKENVSPRLADARARGAHRMVDQTLDLADKATEDDVQVKRLQVATLQWTAEAWNRTDYGKQRGPVVNVSIAELHLEALKAVNAKHSALPAAIAVDAEVLSIEESTTSNDDVTV